MNVPRVIDYWSFDVEGAEEFIATAFPWGEYFPQLVTVERPSRKLQDLMYTNGLRYMCNSGNFGDQMWCSASKWDEYFAKLEAEADAGRDPWRGMPAVSSAKDTPADWGMGTLEGGNGKPLRCMGRGQDHYPGIDGS